MQAIPLLFLLLLLVGPSLCQHNPFSLRFYDKSTRNGPTLVWKPGDSIPASSEGFFIELSEATYSMIQFVFPNLNWNGFYADVVIDPPRQAGDPPCRDASIDNPDAISGRSRIDVCEAAQTFAPHAFFTGAVSRQSPDFNIVSWWNSLDSLTIAESYGYIATATVQLLTNLCPGQIACPVQDACQDLSTRWKLLDNQNFVVRDMYAPNCGTSFNQAGPTSLTSPLYVCPSTTGYTDCALAQRINAGILNRAFAVLVDGYNGTDALGVNKAFAIFAGAASSLSRSTTFSEHANRLEASCYSLVSSGNVIRNPITGADDVVAGVVTNADCQTLSIVLNDIVELRSRTVCTKTQNFSCKGTRGLPWGSWIALGIAIALIVALIVALFILGFFPCFANGLCPKKKLKKNGHIEDKEATGSKVDEPDGVEMQNKDPNLPPIKPQPSAEIDDHLLTIKQLSKRYKNHLKRKAIPESQGLSEEDASALLLANGRNRLTPAVQTPEIVKFLLQFTNIFMILLMVAGGLCLMAYGIDNTTKINLWVGVILFIIVVITCVFSYLQERSTGDTAAVIRNMLPDQALVVRGGQERMIKAEELVVGDLVHLKLGDKVPADIRLVKCDGFKVEASSLTGESDAITCGVEPTDEAAVESTNMIWNSSLILEGDGYGIVIKTGDNTLIGTINKLAGQTDNHYDSRNC